MLQQSKELARIDGELVEYLLVGEGSPAVILMNGGDGPIEGWYKILPALAAVSTILAYNRAGVGRTTKAADKQTSELIVAKLRRLLTHLALTPPYIIVGHSLGGLHANYFARTYPDEICGLVLLDATAPDDAALMAASLSLLQRRLQGLSDWLFDRRGIGEAANASASVSLVQAAGTFPEVPLAVVSGGRVKMPEQARQARLQNQERLSELSPKGKHVIAARSGHFPQFSEPDLVIRTIVQLIAEVRGVPPPS